MTAISDIKLDPFTALDDYPLNPDFDALVAMTPQPVIDPLELVLPAPTVIADVDVFPTVAQMLADLDVPPQVWPTVAEIEAELAAREAAANAPETALETVANALREAVATEVPEEVEGTA